MKSSLPSSLFKVQFYTLILSLAIAIRSEAQRFNVLSPLGSGDGLMPSSLVQGADGDFYGVGLGGGYFDGGTIFKVSPAGTVTPLYIFCLQALCPDGRTPNGLVLARDGNFYGTTRYGGGGDNGTIFRVTTTGTVTTLYRFCAAYRVCTDGVVPEGELIQGTDGDLYGTTFHGGNHDGGTVFKITLSGVFTSLYSFCSKSPNCADGTNPSAGLVEVSNGLFYGTTSGGGGGSCEGFPHPFFQGCGTVFGISPTGKLTTLYNFCAQPNCTDGLFPETSLILAADGRVYGTTSSGGLGDGTCTTGCGTAFRIAPNRTLSILHAFTNGEGARVQNLIQANDGSFYGTALSGGSSSLGTLFKMDSAGSVMVLYNFCNQPSCRYSFNPSGVMQATNGLFYGTTLGNGHGKVFTFGYPPFIKISPRWGPIGTTITIYGTDLLGATAVAFNGVSATFTIVSSSEITTSVPAGTPLSSKVTVTTPSDTLVSDVGFHITQ